MRILRYSIPALILLVGALVPFRAPAQDDADRQWQQHRSLSPLGPNRTLVVDTIAFSLRRPWSGIPASENLARHAWRNHIQARQRRLAQLFATSPTRQQAQ